jgi:NADH-quinone oxidoreductase subunit E
MTACSRCSRANAWALCADSPVMLVNDRTMCIFMSNEKLDQLIDGLRASSTGEAK